MPYQIVSGSGAAFEAAYNAAISGGAGPSGNMTAGSSLNQLVYVTGQQSPYQVISGSGASFEAALNAAVDGGAVLMGPLVGSGGASTLHQLFIITTPLRSRKRSKTARARKR